MSNTISAESNTYTHSNYFIDVILKFSWLIVYLKDVDILNFLYTQTNKKFHSLVILKGSNAIYV